MIVIIDFGMGNLRSVQKAIEAVGAAAEITSDPERVAASQGDPARCGSVCRRHGRTTTDRAGRVVLRGRSRRQAVPWESAWASSSCSTAAPKTASTTGLACFPAASFASPPGRA